MLHVTNGESAAGLLRAAALGGDVLAWNDVLHEGPVPPMPEEELRRVRAEFLAGEGRTRDRVFRELSERDARLSRAASDEAIVLWFEHDLYDQLQLVQILVQLAAARGDPARVSLICGAEYLGLSAPGRLRERFPARAALDEATLDLARRAWAAFRSPDPTALTALLDGDTGALPFLGPALRRYLQQFPSAFNGLSRSEHQALEAIAAGAARLRDAYVRSHHDREEAIFLGDAIFLGYMRDLSGGASPLVTIGEGPGPMDAPIGLTPAGEEVLRGTRDRVVLNGLDRWLGGVHLQGRRVWRWTGSALLGPDGNEP